MLYRPEIFEPLTDTPWAAAPARDRIASVIADTEAAFTPAGLWPADVWDQWTSPAPLTSLYVGAAGVVWALARLRERGYGGGQLDLAAAAGQTLEAWRVEPDFPADVELPREAQSALLAGEAGVLLVAHELAPSGALGDDLHARVRENVANEARELMWGSPGTMLAARAMLAATGEARWRDAWLESAAALLQARDADGLWMQSLYGDERRSLTPPHGLVGIVAELLAGEALLAGETRDELRRTTGRLLAETAVVEDGLATWPLAYGRGLVAGDGEIRLQWCGGAPGMVIAAASYLDEELLLAGAELVWRAGPLGLEKGPSICHGTAGNGYALLKAWQRTGDERWLERARCFAVHALDQVERLRGSRGRGRYSLWTGDVGAALFAADCLDERSAYPVTDAWRW